MLSFLSANYSSFLTNLLFVFVVTINLEKLKQMCTVQHSLGNFMNMKKKPFENNVEKGAKSIFSLTHNFYYCSPNTYNFSVTYFLFFSSANANESV